MHFSISLALKVAEQPAATCQGEWFLLPVFLSAFLTLTISAPVTFAFRHPEFLTIPKKEKKLTIIFISWKTGGLIKS